LATTSSDHLKLSEKLPLFIKPEVLAFCPEDTLTHKQKLVISNPYNFTIKYKIFCTEPRNYVVAESKGIIREKRYSDVGIRRIEFSLESLSRADKFRVQVYKAATRSVDQQNSDWELIGVREISTSIINTKHPQIPSQDFKNITAENLDETSSLKSYSFEENKRSTSSGFCTERLLLVIAGLLCLVAISLPTTGEEDPNSILPSYLTLTTCQKNVLCYFLGLLTWAVFK